MQTAWALPGPPSPGGRASVPALQRKRQPEFQNIPKCRCPGVLDVYSHDEKMGGLDFFVVIVTEVTLIVVIMLVYAGFV